MLSQFGKRFSERRKCSPSLGNHFRNVGNALPGWETIFGTSEMLSRVGKPFSEPKKCFPGLGNDFLNLKNAFPGWETIFGM